MIADAAIVGRRVGVKVLESGRNNDIVSHRTIAWVAALLLVMVPYYVKRKTLYEKL